MQGRLVRISYERSSSMFVLVLFTVVGADLPPTCDSEIYCQGDLLHAVQMAKLFEDSKTFVDLKLLNDEATVLKNFNELEVKFLRKIPKDVLQSFVDSNFIDCEKDPTCRELLPWEPSDWKSHPDVLSKIKDPNYRDWAARLNDLWKKLGRIMDDQVKQDANRTSLIYVPNGFIVPGGRFEEMYYWDTFWVIRGLLVSGLSKTVKGIIENFLGLVDTLGHIPNGSRVYYLRRTQPPLLIHMVEAYVERTKDKSFIKRNIHILDREMEYYVSNRRIEVEKVGKKYKLYRYFAPTSGPRPESYREDYQHGQRKDTEEERRKFFIGLKSGAESGWDFSSRWFLKNKTNQGTLLDIDAQHIVPVDLNAFLHKNFKLLADWYSEFGPESRMKYFRQLENELLIAIEEVLWNEQDGIWYDFDYSNGIPRQYFYLSNFAPLWTESYAFDKENLTKSMLKYLTSVELMKFIGGTPTSLTYSGEQWDYPDAWPPAQTFLLEGLDKLGKFAATETSYNLANQWVKSNYHGYCKYGKMFEKYNALNLGEPGSGGEYQDQEGFGWTNGLIMMLLERYGDILTSSETCTPPVSFAKRAHQPTSLYLVTDHF